MLVKLPKNFFLCLELTIFVFIIAFDFFSPTLIIITFLILSVIFKNFHFSSLGFKKISLFPQTIFLITIFVLLLQLFDIGVLMPILNRLTGTNIDYSQFNGISGNYSKLLLLLSLSWTLVAVGEEVVYRGFIYSLLQKFAPHISYLPIVLSSIIFALAHTEQGLVGVIVSGFDGLMFCLIKQKFNNNLWASILAHGIYNTIGIVVFFYFGPIYQLW